MSFGYSSGQKIFRYAYTINSTYSAALNLSYSRADWQVPLLPARLNHEQDLAPAKLRKGIAGTQISSRMRMTRSAPSSRSCHECDEGVERATVMAAAPSSCGRKVWLASFERRPRRRAWGIFTMKKLVLRFHTARGVF